MGKRSQNLVRKADPEIAKTVTTVSDLVASNLRRLREEAGMSGPEVADLMGISVGCIYTYELGQRLAHGGQLAALAKIYGVDPGVLFIDPLDFQPYCPECDKRMTQGYGDPFCSKCGTKIVDYEDFKEETAPREDDASKKGKARKSKR